MIENDNSSPQPLLITADRVWTGTDAGTIVDGAVLLRDGLIVDIGHRSRFANIAGVARVELGDATLLPGFVDAHVHLYGKDWDGRLLLLHGVTAVRDVGNRFPEIIQLRERQAAGIWSGPRILACGPLLDGAEPHWPHIGFGTTNGRSVESVVDELLAGGVDGYKTYIHTPADIVARIVRQAHNHGKRVSCHAGATSVTQAVELGMDCIEHVVTLGAEVLLPGEGWHQLDPESRAVDEIIQRFKDHGTWFDPTLGVMEGEMFYWGPHFKATPGYELCTPALRTWLRNYLAAQQDAYHWNEMRLAAAAEGLRRSQLLVRRFYEAGVPLLVGSDMPFVPPGIGVHYELQLLAGAGIPNDAILRMATVNAAAFLGLSDHIGALAPGLVADLIAVKGDPLLNITASQEIIEVWQAGRRVDRIRLRSEALHTLNTLSSDYDPKRPPFGIPEYIGDKP